MDELRRRLQARPDSEHEQVAIRALIALLALIYLSFAGPCLPLAIAYVTGSLLLLAHLLWRPGALPAPAAPAVGRAGAWAASAPGRPPSAPAVSSRRPVSTAGRDPT